MFLLLAGCCVHGSVHLTNCCYIGSDGKTGYRTTDSRVVLSSHVELEYGPFKLKVAILLKH